MKKIVSIIFLFCWHCSFAQNEYEHWMVSTYEINFCDSVVLYDESSLPNSINEGFATICDKNTGRILFYTDAQEVLNSNFQRMPHGLGLNGGPDNSQASLIVPQPGSTNIFYIFTTQRYDTYGLNYSIVDMSKDGGLGDVTVKNIFLDSASERLNAVYDAVNNSFWVISDNPTTNNFMSFKLDANGLNTNPVLSPTHIIIDTIYQNEEYLKSSPDGNHVVVTFEYPAMIGLYDFDKSSGVLILQTFLPVGNDTFYIYGASFSPDNSKVYISGADYGETSNIYQYDITSNDTNTIKESKILIGSIAAHSQDRFVGMQMGPDGEIYVVREEYNNLSLINAPNLSGAACQFALDEIPIPTQNYIDALNNNIDGLYYFATAPNITLSSDGTGCNKMASFTISTQRTYNYFTVYFGDGTSANLDSTQYTFSHQYDSAGTYTVKLYTQIGCVYDSATTTVTVTSEACPQPLVIPNLIYGRGSQTQWQILNLPQDNNSVTIYDELGRVIYATNNYPNNYDMKNLPPAMYFYRLTLQSGQVYAGKIVLIK